MPPLTRASPVFQKCRHFQLTRPHRQRYAQVQQGFSRRLQLYVQPKLGRCLEWRLAPYSRRGDSITQQVDPYTLSRNYRTSDYDVRHNISANFYYTLTLRLRIALNTLIGGGNTGGTIFYRTVSPSACINSRITDGLFGNTTYFDGCSCGPSRRAKQYPGFPFRFSEVKPYARTSSAVSNTLTFLEEHVLEREDPVLEVRRFHVYEPGLSEGVRQHRHTLRRGEKMHGERA